MSTTSAYGWNIPDNTDLVKDGALAIRTLGNAIDTSMNTALGTKKAGMVLLNTTSFSAVSSVSLPANTFSSSYDNYKVFVTFDSNSAASSKRLRFRTAGTDNTASNYNAALSIVRFAGTSVIGGGANVNIFEILFNDTQGSASFDVVSPNRATLTQIVNLSATANNGEVFMGAAQFNAATVFDSLSIIASTGTMGGTITCFGYNK